MSENRQYALIIGGSGSLGQALIPKLTQQGFTVLIADKRPPENAGTEFFYVDATNSQSFEKLSEDLKSENVQLSHVINCVGVRIESGLTDMFKTKSHEIRDTIALNLESQINAVRYLGEQVMQTDAYDKSFTMISSINAHHAYSIAFYSAAKAGLNGFLRPAAMELGKGNVRINIVTPGSVETPVTHKEPKNFAARAQATALRRLANCDEVVDGIMASVSLTGMTGQEIVIDAGQSINPSESLYDQIRKATPAP